MEKTNSLLSSKCPITTFICKEPGNSLIKAALITVNLFYELNLLCRDFHNGCNLKVKKQQKKL